MGKSLTIRRRQGYGGQAKREKIFDHRIHRKPQKQSTARFTAGTEGEF